MLKTLTPGMHVPNTDVYLAQRMLQNAGYTCPQHGFYEDDTEEVVRLFQTQHVDARGRSLASDGVVGPATWWALENPSGATQRSGNPYHLAGQVPAGPRRDLLEAGMLEYSKDVVEVPDGSNRGPFIDLYWGNTGVIGQPWCCAFVSAMLMRVLGRYPVGRHHIAVQRMWEEAKYLGLTTTRPKPGDIFVQLFKKGTGHTGFGIAFDRNGQFATLEGNCGNRLKNGRRSASTIQGWIDPFQDGQPQVFQNLLAGIGSEGDSTR